MTDATATARPTPPIGRIDDRLRASGFTAIAGCDEAGRGALAGPLVAAAVVLDPDRVPDGLTDSKLLTAAQRERLNGEIRRTAVAVAVRRVRPERIDRIGLQRANIEALQLALRKLEVEVDYVLVDGLFRLRLHTPHLRVIKGDRTSTSIAAASIVAKVTRDRTMVRMARRYPAYGWERNKGYGAAEHRDALDAHGPTPLHRRCFAPVAQLRLDLDEPPTSALEGTEVPDDPAADHRELPVAAGTNVTTDGP